MSDVMQAIRSHLVALYGESCSAGAYERLVSLLDNYRGAVPAPVSSGLRARDAILITYGDQVRVPGEAPLRTLAAFCARHLTGSVSGIHLLPFYPYSSDDGFSVKDYRMVDPALGDWADIRALGTNYRLMFDAVINHASAQGRWFQGFLAGEAPYRDYFIVVPDGADVSRVVRPRTLPLLTEFATREGVKKVWTTFSADQVDLDYRNPEVLLEIVDTLLFYAAQGASLIRLDAIAYLWKEYGTPCIHLPQTHRVIQLLRAVLDEVAPHVMLVTETNVPHRDNVSYFGEGHDEATMVYNFALPPLVLHTFGTGDATALSGWAKGLDLPSDEVTFFNFLASHDGIGLNPARGILSDAEIRALVERGQAHGGRVSHKTNPDGSASPYELNINYYDALSDRGAGEPLGTQVDRFVAAHAVMLALKGVPGIYFHSLFGSRGWPEGVALLGHNRAINREKLDAADLERELAVPSGRRSRVLARFRGLLAARAANAAFDPCGNQLVVDAGPHIFALLRTGGAGRSRVLCLQNVSAGPQPLEIDWGALGLESDPVVDLETGRRVPQAEARTLSPYQVLWLAAIQPDGNLGH